ncbi:hypothetical protein HU200_034499 [Digitaria exilis]|uniref:Uncharacterized protein n=1 Tax=Digitaria exilis TaxID=1010633 RepID=A0A835BVB3_9POAL|nr:hypothetical protein HU200_034499 [Digitaria exilis]
MAEMISSAVALEAVHHVLSRLMERYEHSSDTKEHMERMEMTHIMLETTLKASQRWSITSALLLRWRSKLKRAAQECGVCKKNRKRCPLSLVRWEDPPYRSVIRGVR